LDMDTYP